MKRTIDLSMLTPSEQQQFAEDDYTLHHGDINVALYLRYSSERQSEQSIEGQLRDCIAYCKHKGYCIKAVYVDRATSARKDIEKRLHFQQMMNDSKHRWWDLVIVWKLDRFSRNREDSAVYKMRLRKNGVRVESATEAISNTPEGIILESVLEGIAEYYSADLSQKITRGLRESALKGQCIGGHIPLGYKLEDHKFIINPATAHIVKEAFTLYAGGESIADICREFNAKGYRTAKGTEFNRSSFKAMFKNQRYLGVYTYKDISIEGAIPAIIDRDLFEAVQIRLQLTATAPARGKAKVDYLLSGKIFCGHCGTSMIGESGKSKTGTIYHYYTCATRKKSRGCDKRPVRKEWIETIVAQNALSLLTDDLIEEIANTAFAQSQEEMQETTILPELNAKRKELEASMRNILKAIEKGVVSDTLTTRLVELEQEHRGILKQIADEEENIFELEPAHIVYWLEKFRDGDIQDDNFKRRLLDTLINSVTVWDEPDGYKVVIGYNLTSCPTKTLNCSQKSGFVFEEASCTIGSVSELFIRGSVLFQTKKHSLP